MTHISTRSRRPAPASRAFLAILCAVLLVPGEGALLAQAAPPAAPAAPAQAADAPLTADQLESLVAPVALYPDDLLAQVLAASTYPLEIIQLQQFLAKNPNLKDKALVDAVAKQPWDPAVQSMAAFPDAVKRLSDDIQWTTDLGNAFLDQQKDVMDACQRMRKKAKDKGTLTSNEQMKVETKVVEQQTVIVVQSANPEVIYVPVYSPTVVYPPPVYPYPPIYYPPPPPPGAAFMTFTMGVMIGAAWGGSCCHCGWGGNNTVNINVNNNFNKNTNINRSGGGGSNWSHNSAHRGGAPYSSSASANKYGGSAKGGSQGARGASPSASSANRGGGAGASPSASSANRGGGGASPSASPASKGGGASPSASSASKGGSGGGSPGAMSGGSGGFSSSSAKTSSSRGASSMSSGGGSRGGGGGRGGRR